MFSTDIGFRYSANLFIRGLGLLYLVSLYSLWTQIHGLIGAGGILPVAEVFGATDQPALTLRSWFAQPTLLWWFYSDAALSILCIGGMVMSMLLAAGVLPIVCLIVIWIIYLSLAAGAPVWVNLMPDLLILEAGFLAIFLAPPVLVSRPSRNPEPPRFVVFLLALLLFRVLFTAGFSKVSSPESPWFDFSALTYYFWAQPLPAWTSWYFHQMPVWFLKGAAMLVLLVELVVPWLIFTTRTLRTAAFGLIVFLQLMIGATGNHGAMNLLVMLLCLMLLDDGWFENEHTRTPALLNPVFRTVHGLVRVPAVCAIMLVALMTLAGLFARNMVWPRPFVAVAEAMAPFHIVNRYDAAFGVMDRRPEIIIEGSRDGREWKVYGFTCKPQDELRTPPVLAPHLPRLDWMMATAAHQHYRDVPWMGPFLARLIEGSPDTLDLLEINPFGSDPPRFVRAVLYHYTFASPGENRERGAWWKRELKGLYTPVVNGRL